MTTITSVCVFCGSKIGANTSYAQQARILGEQLAAHHIRLIYGGGDLGLMGTVSKSVRENGGKITGIIPEFLMEKERDRLSVDYLDELIVTKNMHERKMLMFEHADAFVALPGGIGTLEELVEQMTWSQLGQHKKPILIANFDQFWTPFLNLVRHMRAEGFLGGKYDVDYLIADEASAIVPLITNNAARTASASEAVATDIKSQM